MRRIAAKRDGSGKGEGETRRQSSNVSTGLGTRKNVNVADPTNRRGGVKTKNLSIVLWGLDQSVRRDPMEYGVDFR